MFEVFDILKRIVEECDRQVCIYCPYRYDKPINKHEYEMVCNLNELFELLASDEPRHWDLEKIEEVLKRD